MNRCFGLNTKNLNRCSRRGDWKFFCHEHKKQPIVFLFFLLGVFGGIASILSYLSSPSGINDHESKLAPAREIIVRSIAKTYSTSFHAATQLMDFSYNDCNNMNSNKLKCKSLYLEIALQDLGRLKANVPLNSQALDPDLVSILSPFLESSDKLLSQLKYYLLLHNDAFNDRDFVTAPPFHELETMEALAIKLKERYGQVFYDKHVVFSYLKTCKEIEEVWEEAAKRTCRMFFQPFKYQYRQDRIPFIYDLKNLKAIPSKTLQDGVQAQVFSIN